MFRNLAKGSLTTGVSRRLPEWTALLVGGVFLGLVTQLPLRHAVKIGADEGFELLKGMMVARGFHLYIPLWNDQPPLHTLIVAGTFRLLGPSAFVARLVTVAFALLLLFSLVFLICRAEGSRTALLSALLLFCAPWFLILATSAMLELPAVAAGYCSAAVLLCPARFPSQRRVFASGLIFGVALMIKLTAALLAPGILVSMFVADTSNLARTRVLATLKRCWMWTLGAGLVVVLIMLSYHGLSVHTLLSEHFSPRMRHTLAGRPELRFRPLQLLHEHPEAMAALPVALILAYLENKFREILFPLVNLLVAGAAFYLNVPCWGYYYLHLVVPLAWLSAVGIKFPFHRAFAARAGSGSGGVSLEQFGWLCLGSGLLAFALVQGAVRERKMCYAIRGTEAVGDSKIIAEMKRNLGEAQYVYAVQPEYAFYAGTPCVPELAVMPLNRYAAGELDAERIVAILSRYKPAMLVLNDTDLHNDAWTKFLTAYKLVIDSGDLALCLRNQ